MIVYQRLYWYRIFMNSLIFDQWHGSWLFYKPYTDMISYHGCLTGVCWIKLKSVGDKILNIIYSWYIDKIQEFISSGESFTERKETIVKLCPV